MISKYDIKYSLSLSIVNTKYRINTMHRNDIISKLLKGLFQNKTSATITDIWCDKM